jgi:hypothetical protein
LLALLTLLEWHPRRGPGQGAIPVDLKSWPREREDLFLDAPPPLYFRHLAIQDPAKLRYRQKRRPALRQSI